MTAGLQSAEPDPETVREHLHLYLGSWKGEISVETEDGKVLRTIPVAAEYWQAGERVKGLTAFDFEGKMTFVESVNYFRNRLLFADVEQDGKSLTYRGFLRGEEIVWVPYDAELNTERRMREWFGEEEGVRVLNVEGVELIRSEKGTAQVFLRAKMMRQP